MQETPDLGLQTMAVHVFMELTLAQGHCHARKGLNLLISLLGNCNAQDILYTYASIYLWQQFGEEPHMGEMLRCPKTLLYLRCKDMWQM